MDKRALEDLACSIADDADVDCPPIKWFGEEDWSLSGGVTTGKGVCLSESLLAADDTVSAFVVAHEVGHYSPGMVLWQLPVLVVATALMTLLDHIISRRIKRVGVSFLLTMVLVTPILVVAVGWVEEYRADSFAAKWVGAELVEPRYFARGMNYLSSKSYQAMSPTGGTVSWDTYTAAKQACIDSL